jgi:hypothetical protein
MKIKKIQAFLVAAALAAAFAPALADPWLETAGAAILPPGDDSAAREAKIVDVVTDDLGNIYVAGWFTGVLDLGDFTLLSEYPEDRLSFVSNAFVAKMDRAGNWLWANQAYGGYDPWKSDSYANAIAVDSEGSVYVTGHFKGRVSFGAVPLDIRDQNVSYLCNSNTSVSCTDENGNPKQEWCDTVSAGTCIANQPENAFIGKLDAAGDWVWASQAGGGGTAVGNDVAVGPDPTRPSGDGGFLDAVYVIGETEANNDVAGQRFGPVTGVTCHYTCDQGPDAAVPGQAQAGDPCSEHDDCASGVCLGLDPADACESDVFLAKIRPDGLWLSAQRYGGSDQDDGVAVAVDEAGDVVIAANARREISYQRTSDYTCCKLRILGICFDWGTCTNYFDVSATRHCAQTSKLSVDPSRAWSHTLCSDTRRTDASHVNGAGYPMVLGILWVAPESIAIDHVGNVYVTGWFDGILLDPDGTDTTIRFAESGYDYDYWDDDPPEELWCYGDSWASACEYKQDTFIVRYGNDPEGTLRWTDSIGRDYSFQDPAGDPAVCTLVGWFVSCNYATDDYGRSITIDEYGDIYVAGWSEDSVGNHVLLTRWEPQGDARWSKLISTGGGNADPQAVALGSDRTLVVGGFFQDQGSIEFSDGVSTVSPDTDGSTTAFVTTFDHLGAWGERFPVSVSLLREGTTNPHFLYEDEPTPSVGNTWFMAGDVVAASTPAVDDRPGTTGEEDFFTRGWLGAGSVPDEGDGNAVSFTVDQDSALTWIYAGTSTLEIGKPISRPAGAADMLPDWEDIEVVGDGEAQVSFVRSEPDGKLYAVRPLVADIGWHREDDPDGEGRITQRYVFSWPEDAQVHVAGAPVSLQPEGTEYQSLGLLFSEGPGPRVEGTEFSAPEDGHSVLHYASTNGDDYDPGVHAAVIQVVHTVALEGLCQDPGPYFGSLCSNDADCGGGTCAAYDILRCAAGTNDGKVCAVDADCPGGACLPPADTICDIGEPLPSLAHDADAGSGFVFHLREGHGLLPPYDAFDDAAQPDGAYDRTLRAGPIIPVNEVVTGIHDELIVAWYEEGSVPGVYWPHMAERYDPVWPATAQQIEIASEKGSESVPGQDLLDPTVFLQTRIYDQRDRLRPGVKPNIEHALFAQSNDVSSYEAVFALRTDLGPEFYDNPDNPLPGIQPHVLMKYWKTDGTEDPSSHWPAGQARWAFLVYDVVAPAAGDLTYADVPAGTTLRPPYPIGTLSLCPETRADNENPAFWMDYKNTAWAVAATEPLAGAPAEQPPDDNPGVSAMTVRYWYPLQPGFYYDFDGDGAPDEPAGTCVRWLDRLVAPLLCEDDSTTCSTDADCVGIGSGSCQGTPLDVTYDADWPSAPPELQVGETLIRPKRGLPEIMNQAAAEIAYDDVYSKRADPASMDSLAKIFDTLSARSVALASLPGKVATETNERGERVLVSNDDGTVKLPFHIKTRTYFSPITQELHFRGYFDESGAGEPLLLLNVMTQDERDRLLELTGETEATCPDAGTCDTTCSNDPTGEPCAECSYCRAVLDLYDLTRNPDGLDLDPSGVLDDGNERDDVADQALLIGLQDLLDENGDPIAGGDGIPEPYRSFGVPGALTAGAAAGSGYLTLAFNNDPSLSPLPVSVNVIRVGCPPYRGELKVIESDNVFDEQLTLRHSGDFGAEPEKFWFEWRRTTDPADKLDPSRECLPDDDPLDCDPRVPWTAVPVPLSGQGRSDLTIESDDPAVLLADQYYFVNYRAYNGIDGPEDWAYQICEAEHPIPPELWAGAPGSTEENPHAMLGEGWVKRVIRDFNTFEDRVTRFHTTRSDPYTSMLTQLGERYEGDIAFTNDPDYLNSIGMIEAYETLLRRAKRLSAGVNDEGVDNAIFFNDTATTEIYTVLGNEGSRRS